MGFRLDQTARLQFTGSRFEGAEVVVSLSIPFEVYFDVAELAETEKFRELFTKCSEASVVEEWNLEDKQGNPIPVDGECFLKIPPDLAGLIISAWQEAIGGVDAPLAKESSNGTKEVELNLGDFSELS